MLEKKRIFITGGGGFIGGFLAKKLLSKNKVLIYDTFERTSLQHQSLKNDKLKIVHGDVLDKEGLKNALHQYMPTHIVHCAAIAGIDTVIKSPTKTLTVNVIGTSNLLEAVHELNLSCERLLFLSTSEIFGQHAFQSTENHSAVIGAVGEARWTYAVSKLTNEHFAFSYQKEFGLPCTVVRPFNVYGPGQVGEGALSTFIKRAIKNEPIYIHGDGTQIRAWCYIEDMIEGLLKCLTEPKAIGETFNIGNAKAVLTIYGLANSVCRILGSQSDIIFSGKTNADVELRIPDVNKSKKILNFEAKIDLEEGIPLTGEYYAKQL